MKLEICEFDLVSSNHETDLSYRIVLNNHPAGDIEDIWKRVGKVYDD